MDNVISLFARAKAKGEAEVKSTTVQQQQELIQPVNEAVQPVVIQPITPVKQDFGSIASRNASIQEKLRKERAEANKNVLKSYRIK